jgi:hypothetical protein
VGAAIEVVDLAKAHDELHAVVAAAAKLFGWEAA